MEQKIDISCVFEATSEELFNAWLSSDEHTEMTGGEATIEPITGSSFKTWDGYISGKNLEIIPYSKIIQSWRTTEFSETDEDSILTLEFIDLGDKTELRLSQIKIPDGQADSYKQGWEDYYFKPMRDFFQHP